MDTSPTKATESELSQDNDKKQVTVQPVREPKRAVESKESFCHSGQGSSPKVPKLQSTTESSEQCGLGDSQRKELSTSYVRSLREADWNKVKALAEKFETSTEPLDKINQNLLLSSLYCHVRGNCGNLSNIYWKKPTFAHISYLRKLRSWKEGVRVPGSTNTTK
jgi:hypothetical protein